MNMLGATSNCNRAWQKYYSVLVRHIPSDSGAYYVPFRSIPSYTCIFHRIPFYYGASSVPFWPIPSHSGIFLPIRSYFGAYSVPFRHSQSYSGEYSVSFRHSSTRHNVCTTRHRCIPTRHRASVHTNSASFHAITTSYDASSVIVHHIPVHMPPHSGTYSVPFPRMPPCSVIFGPSPARTPSIPSYYGIAWQTLSYSVPFRGISRPISCFYVP